MRGNRYAGGFSPITSHRAVGRMMSQLDLHKIECRRIIIAIGRPCTGPEIRDYAIKTMGLEVGVADSIRRRTKDLKNDGIIYVVSSQGRCELLWLVGVPIPGVIPLRTKKTIKRVPRS